MFTQRISMDCTREQYETQLREELLKMGYDDAEVTFWKEETVIVNNTDGEMGGLGTFIGVCKEKYDRTYLGPFNAPLFLALAAMTDEVEGNYGEYIIGLLSYSLYKMEEGDRILPEHKLIRKATKDEIMAKFMGIKFKVCTQPKTEIKMAEFKVKRSELQKVYEVACSDWKDRIIRMIGKYGDPFSASVTLPEEEVRQMFKAATSDQTKILRKVFPVWEDQGPVRNLSEGEEKRVDELLQELSILLFGDTDELQLAKGWAARQPELKGKTIGVPSFGVRLHESKVVSGVTLIEFTRK